MLLSTTDPFPGLIYISSRMVVTRRQSLAANDINNDSEAESCADTISAAVKISSADHRVSQSKSKSAGSTTPKAKKMGDFVVRAIVSFFMAAFFCLVILAGHMWVAIVVVLMEVGMFREILGLGYAVAAGGRIPLWRTTGWYFFLSCLYLFYGKAILAHFEDQKRPFMSHGAWQYALRHHTFISFVLYCGGCVGFVLSLKPGQYSFQFSYFGRTLALIVLVVVQSHFMILNLRQGMFWFILPSALVIINDSFAYFCGRLFGRHSLTSLSPKKTWEGYIGAGVFTMITAYFLSGWLTRFPSIICPKFEFTDCVYFCRPFTCDPVPPVFVKQVASIELFPGILPAFNITYIPVQLHAMALGLFASAIGPFGGFFASGAKRAFEIKDFANIFPGHGGVTDRVDCQLLMAVFTYVYVINFVQVTFSGSPDVGKIMAFVSELSTGEQIQLLAELQSRLVRKGAISGIAKAATEGVAKSITS